ncbi:MAG: hypothetical protein A4S12_12410 [Proteobacteria bacterium SG_bin5]|nr:hypothetical protein [Sphingomonas sp.]OQW38610.1 MAG: hypothetical protein A4S12_12410 [Proteobacteria bacterium SG_bin5]
MARSAARVFLGLAGALAVVLWGLAWFDLPRLSAALGPVAPTPLAAATLRADLGGFFAAWGVGALGAAWRGDRTLALLPMLLLALAFAGRLYTFALTGDRAIVPPMMVEAALFMGIAIARAGLRRL